jgi:DNA mismatch endonuclease (patch repair protein)
MVDRITQAQRSAVMSRIRSKNTSPELRVRRLLHGLGYRFRLHARDLPGTPDLVFRRRKAAIQVHGCYWHGHTCRIAGKPAQSNTEYWGPKIARTQARDSRNAKLLMAMGWRLLTLWECETLIGDPVVERLTTFLGPPGQP